MCHNDAKRNLGRFSKTRLAVFLNLKISRLNGIVIERVYEYKPPGIWLHKKLTFKTHIKALADWSCRRIISFMDKKKILILQIWAHVDIFISARLCYYLYWSIWHYFISSSCCLHSAVRFITAGCNGTRTLHCTFRQNKGLEGQVHHCFLFICTAFLMLF